MRNRNFRARNEKNLPWDFFSHSGNFDEISCKRNARISAKSFQKMIPATKCKSYLLFFSKNISIYVINNDQSFNDTLTNDIVSFNQLGPDIFLTSHEKHTLWVLIRSAFRHFR